MMWLKACPRCHGDLLRQSDNYGPYVGCLQGGHILRSEEELRLTSALAGLPSVASEWRTVC